MPGFENQSFMGAIPGEYETKKKGAEMVQLIRPSIQIL